MSFHVFSPGENSMYVTVDDMWFIHNPWPLCYKRGVVKRQMTYFTDYPTLLMFDTLIYVPRGVSPGFTLTSDRKVRLFTTSVFRSSPPRGWCGCRGPSPPVPLGTLRPSPVPLGPSSRSVRPTLRPEWGSENFQKSGSSSSESKRKIKKG